MRSNDKGKVMSLHSFEPDVASEVGVNAAVIYQNIVFWCEKNAANDRHIHDGLAWTYNSTRAFAEMFPYLTGDQVRRAIERLVEKGYIAIGNFNETAYDRTRWFCDLRQVHLASVPNGSGENAEPIPDSKPYTKPDTKRAREFEPSLFSEEDQPKQRIETARSIEEKFNEFYKAYPKKVGPDAARKNFAKAVKGGADPDEIIAGARRYADWLATGGPRDFRPNPKNPQGWLTEGRWKDDLQEDKPARTHRLRENWAGVER